MGYFAALLLIMSLMGSSASALPITGNGEASIYAPAGTEGSTNYENSYYNGYDSNSAPGYGSSGEGYGGIDEGYGSIDEGYGGIDEGYENSLSRGQSYYTDYPYRQQEVALTLYVLEKNGDGTPLPGVTVNSYDAAGKLFQGKTDRNGFVIISGQPGPWQFAVGMEGYKTLRLAFNVTQTSAAIATIERMGLGMQTDSQAEGMAGRLEEAALPIEETAGRTEETVVLTVYVHEGKLNGTLVGGVFIEGYDAGGERFMGYTGSSGSAPLEGKPGLWQFTFSKEGYDSLRLSYNVTESGEGAVYLKKTVEPSSKVVLTVHLHENSLNGTEISDVLIFGQDGALQSFSETTSSEGTATIVGEPGTWQFVFSKEGYETLHLSYNVTETQDAAAYLKALQPEAQFSLMPPSQ